MKLGLSGRLLRSVVALSLPTAVVVALGVYFLVADVPRIIADEQARVLAETEGAAQALRENPATADFMWERGKGIVAGDRSRADEFPGSLSW